MATSNRGRFSAKRKRESLLSLLLGEDLDLVSREIGVIGVPLSSWRNAFLEGGLGALRARQADDRDEHIRALEQRLGRMVVENELQREQVKRLKEGLPLASRRSRRRRPAAL